MSLFENVCAGPKIVITLEGAILCASQPEEPVPRVASLCHAASSCHATGTQTLARCALIFLGIVEPARNVARCVKYPPYIDMVVPLDKELAKKIGLGHKPRS